MGFTLKRMSGPMRTAWRHAPPGCWPPAVRRPYPGAAFSRWPCREAPRRWRCSGCCARRRGRSGSTGRIPAFSGWMNAVLPRNIPQAITVRPIRNCWRMSQRRQSIRWTVRSIPVSPPWLMRKFCGGTFRRNRGMPRPDCALLGMGDDGHTASPSPGSPLLAPDAAPRWGRLTGAAVAVHLAPEAGSR